MNPSKTSTPAGEKTPLLAGGDGADDVPAPPVLKFRRSHASLRRLQVPQQQQQRQPDHRASVRGMGALTIEEIAAAHLQPADALAPLATGGVIVTSNGYKTKPRAPSVVKSLPAFVPFKRKARHRSFYLWWINEFRHWWKSSRLLVRLAGLFTLAYTASFIPKMVRITPFLPRHHKRKFMAKTAGRAVSVVKKLGRGGPMKYFLLYVHPFTRGVRILVATWRWIEAAQVRRGEVGTEEAMAFIGNRVSRMLARTFVDLFVLDIMMPLMFWTYRWKFIPEESWHPIAFFMTLGILRACAPYAASFQGSRAGRVLTRSFFHAYKHRWRPVQRVQNLNLQSDDCMERDEISQTADLAKLGRIVAKALGKAQEIGVDGFEGQKAALGEEGFHQIGAGSGGYAVYECHRRVWSRGTNESAAPMIILLHVTPYGPSILDVMPRYIVLEFEDSVDRRNNWSEFIAEQYFEGPPVVEGYCYNGAFFSPHHFAALKVMYDKQLLAYDSACQAMVKPRTGRSPNPPSDLLTLKAFLADGKPSRNRKKNDRELRELQAGVGRVAKELKRMMKSNSCTAPRGVILYFEGLDCAGKSSTGGLVEQALQQAGYTVDMRQYNKPPTPAEKLRPWMDRFEIPGTSVAVGIEDGSDDGATKKLIDKCLEHSHNALVWDRGPAGDFVYNPEFRAMQQDERNKKYRDFLAFDKECFDNNILFLKLLFVTNRDSIASTLGKRLAQKHMAKDLRVWLQSSRGEKSEYGDIGFEGLEEVEIHIDPTDFIAFNCYQKNLRIFTNFALNTDSPENPWVVVNTGDRYSARKQLLKAFRMKLDRFKAQKECCRPGRPVSEPTLETPGISQPAMLERGFDKHPPYQLLLAIAGLVILVFYYCEHTSFGSPFADSWIIDDLKNLENNLENITLYV